MLIMLRPPLTILILVLICSSKTVVSSHPLYTSVHEKPGTGATPITNATLTTNATLVTNAHPDTLYSQFLHASSISITPLGTIYITDQDAGKIHSFTIPDHTQSSFGNFGSGPGQFGSPVQIDATNGLKIYIADRGNRRIQLYDRTFQQLSSIQFEHLQDILPAKICVRPTGDLYVYNERSHELIQMDDRGHVRSITDLSRYEIREVTSIASTKNEILLFDRSQQFIHRFNPDGIYIGFTQTPENTLSIRVFQNRIILLHQDGVYETTSTQLRSKTPLVSFPPSISVPFRVDASAPQPVTDFGLTSDAVYLLTTTSLIRIPYDS